MPVMAYLSMEQNLPKNWEVALVIASVDDGMWCNSICFKHLGRKEKAVREDQLLITRILD